MMLQERCAEKELSCGWQEGDVASGALQGDCWVVNEVEDVWGQRRGFGAVRSTDLSPRNPNGILPCHVIAYS